MWTERELTEQERLDGQALAARNAALQAREAWRAAPTAGRREAFLEALATERALWGEACGHFNTVARRYDRFTGECARYLLATLVTEHLRAGHPDVPPAVRQALDGFGLNDNPPPLPAPAPRRATGRPRPIRQARPTRGRGRRAGRNIG